MIHLAKVPTPRCPFADIHAALYSYFPRAAQGERPFVWRIADEGKSIVLLSSMEPATDHARIVIPASRTLEFDLTYKRVRNSDGGRIVVEITSMPELRERMVRWCSARGGEIGFVRLEKMRAIKFDKRQHVIRLPIVDAHGTIYVRDAESFERMLIGGGPGTGKVYGCGLWWLPEIMQPALEVIGKAVAA